MRLGLFLMTALATTAAAAQPAAAQQARRFDVQGMVKVVRDDNVSRSNPLVAAARSVVQEDTITSPSVTVDILQPFGRQALFLTGSAGYNFYEENDKLNRERITMRGGANTSFGPCSTSFTGLYNRQQTELEDITLGPIENTETVEGVIVNGMCGRGVGFVPTFTVSQEWSDNSAASRSTSDYATNMAVVGISYRRPTFGDLSLFGNYTETKYDRGVMDATGLHRDGYEVYGAGVRYTRRIGSRIQGSASVAYTRVDPAVPGVASFSGATYGVDLTFKPTSRISAQAAFSRAISPSNRLQTTYGVKDTISLDGSYALSRRIKLGLGATYFDNAYEYPTAAAAAPALLLITDEQIRSVTASVRFDLNSRLSFIAEANQRERDANVHGLDFTANRFGLSVIANY